MKAKTKTKKNDRKFNRLKIDGKDPPIVETPACDLSKLCKPIDTSLCNLRQVTKLFDTGSEEIKCILAYECEVIYECKICRSLFRSLLNFISHKRIYCPEKFNISCDKSAINPPTMGVEHQPDSESKENCKNERPGKNQDANKNFSKKDLTSVISMLQRKQKDADYDDSKEHNNRMHIIADTEQVLLEVMDSNRAAFQTVLEPLIKNIDSEDLMKAQTTELQTILSRDTAILGPDGQIIELGIDEKCDDPLQFSEREGNVLGSNIVSNNNLVCSICDTRFSTKKTLTFHMKSLHTPNRLVYPCPCCTSLFPNNWGVYRHLVKVHRKSNAQVRKMRTEIQAKAYRRETTRAQDIEKDCADSKLNDLSESQSATNETQEWMAHLESDGELQRCGGCGKRFDRKAALLSHSQICQRRLAACSDSALPKSSKRKSAPEVSAEAPTQPSPPASVVPLPSTDTESASITLKANSPPPSIESVTISVPSPPKTTSLLRLPNISSAVTITPLNQNESAEISIRVEGVSTLSKDDWDKMGTEMSEIVPDTDTVKSHLSVPCETTLTEDPNNDISDDPEIIFTKIEKSKNNGSGNSGSKKRKMGGKRDASIEVPKRSSINSTSESSEKSSAEDKTVIGPVSTLQNKIAKMANFRKLECIPCKRKFSSLADLRRHMSEHINSYVAHRYRCKLCEFRCFDKIDAVAHCNYAHNAKNSRTCIASMISETPINNDNVTNSSRSLLKKKHSLKDMHDLEVIDVTTPTTGASDIANANEEMDCIKNGHINSTTKLGKSNNNNVNDNKDGDILSSDTDEETQEKFGEVAKKARLDEDPELRKMVMEVIFGSSEIGVNDKPSSSMDNSRNSRVNSRESHENRFTSSSDSEQSNVNSTPSTNHYHSSSNESLKIDSRLPRAARNRTKLEDKDFIYDLDAILLKEPVDDDLCAIKITNDSGKTNANNVIDNTKFDNDDLTVILYRDDVAESKLGKVA